MGYRVAVVGATGNVGREMLQILAERNFPADDVVALASARSAGKQTSFGDKSVLKVQDLAKFDFKGIDIVLSSPGAKVSAEEAKGYAATCALNAIAAVKALLGDLDRVSRVVKVVGFVASDPTFTGQPGVINGASELLGEAFGEQGVHARSAVGVAVLPLDAPVEVEIVVSVAD